jgi:hypothetical protein
MTTSCIHGFDPDQCSSCRACVHGLTASRCARCIAATSITTARLRAAALASTFPSEQHAGFEIYWVPAVSGWQFRSPDSAPSPVSYRSAFLARKAVDGLAAE